jgi:hypothetical protein
MNLALSTGSLLLLMPWLPGLQVIDFKKVSACKRLGAKVARPFWVRLAGCEGRIR